MSLTRTYTAGRYVWYPGTRAHAQRSAYSARGMPGTFLGGLPPSGWTQIWEFGRAFYLGRECAAELATEDLADQPNEALWDEAISAIEDFAGRVPAPLVTPLQLGGLSVEWHSHDLDLELRFRVGHPPFTLIDDIRGECAEFRDHDPGLVNAIAAMNLLARRSSQQTSMYAAA
jgi:hypothetical protein